MVYKTRRSDRAESPSKCSLLIFGSGYRNYLSKKISSCLGRFSFGKRRRYEIAFVA